MSFESTAPGFSRRKLLRAGLAGAGALLVSGTAAGCGNPLASSSDPSALTVWDLFSGGDGMLMDEMISAVSGGSGRDAGFSVNRTILDWGASYYTKLAMSAAGGRASDVAALHLSRLAAYAPGGLLDPWDLDLLAEFGVTEENFAPAVWRRAQHDGTVYAIPLDTHPFIVFYDRQVADRAGLLDSSGALAPIDSPEVMIEAGEALAAETGRSGVLFGHVTDTSQNWRLFAGLYAQTGSTFGLPDGGEPQVDREAAVRVVSFLQRLFDGRTNPNNLDYASAMASFLGGRGGLYLSGAWELPTLRESGIDLGAAPLPTLFGEPAVYADSHAFVLPHQDNPDPERRREAHRYVAAILRQSLTWATAGHIPAYQPVLAEPEYAELEPQSSYASAMEVVVLDPPAWFTGAGSDFHSRMTQPLQTALLGGLSAERAVDRMIREADTLLSKPNPVG
ncbi:extracellular solute-binding protein [Streptomyces sp. 7-21]|uniref:extracellular solute-binding protein n=1 Tax=Streptomyces sp. 7-21 TaxID=2802283 RepID=UPI00191ED8DA|nr:extracellular solute-binding protein [Streptomyces sp. 7-21]MBL1065554.1 extracellular solute-binding protein [Streptomyces sp. 7-21]